MGNIAIHQMKIIFGIQECSSDFYMISTIVNTWQWVLRLENIC